MRLSKIIALLLIVTVLGIGVYAGFVKTYHRYDYDAINTSKKLPFQVANSGVNAAEFLTSYIVSSISVQGVSSPCLVLEFRDPLVSFTKFSLHYGEQTRDYVSGPSKYLVMPLDNVHGDIQIEVYGESTLAAAYAVDALPLIAYKQTDAFYYSLLLALAIAAAAWIYAYMFKAPRGSRITRKKFFFHIAYCAGIGLFYLLTKYILLDKMQLYGRFNEYRLLFLACCLYVPYFLYTCRKEMAKLCAISILFIGIMHIVFTPATGVSWDDNTHYKRSLQAAFVSDVQLSQAEAGYMTYPFDSYISIQNRNEAHTRQEMSHQEPAQILKKKPGYSSLYFELPYYPAGVFIWLAHSLGLGYLMTFWLGKLGYLLLYAWIAYLAVKKSRNKLLLTTILTLPTIVFTAANYSYDAWTLGFSALSLVYFIEEMKEETPMSMKNMLIISLSIFLAGSAKIAYLGLMLVYFFVPKRKFSSPSMRLRWYAMLIAVLALSVLAFSLSHYTNADYQGMVHGGMDINIHRQTQFILQNPLRYLKIFFVYLLTRFSSFEYSSGFTVLLGGRFIPIFNYLPQLVMIVIAFLDKEADDKKVPASMRVLLLLASLFSVFLICTAIYLDYTEVGHPTILGVQSRYWIPVLFPILYGVSGPNITNRYPQTTLRLIAVGVNLFLSLIALLTLFVAILY